jgi:hypothetical protein
MIQLNLLLNSYSSLIPPPSSLLFMPHVVYRLYDIVLAAVWLKYNQLAKFNKIDCPHRRGMEVANFPTKGGQS